MPLLVLQLPAKLIGDFQNTRKKGQVAILRRAPCTL